VPDARRALTYVNTSAIVKVLFAEAESEALRRWLAEASPALVSSAPLEVELARTVIRARSQSGARVSDAGVRAVLDAIDLIDLDARQLKVASGLTDAYLRALDAIHLAAALTVSDRLGAILTYDVRMIQRAQACSLMVVAPA
jgi:predicted nucleic acid-binding protein